MVAGEICEWKTLPEQRAFVPSLYENETCLRWTRGFTRRYRSLGVFVFTAANYITYKFTIVLFRLAFLEEAVETVLHGEHVERSKDHIVWFRKSKTHERSVCAINEFGIRVLGITYASFSFREFLDSSQVNDSFSLWLQISSHVQILPRAILERGAFAFRWKSPVIGGVNDGAHIEQLCQTFSVSGKLLHATLDVFAREFLKLRNRESFQLWQINALPSPVLNWRKRAVRREIETEKTFWSLVKVGEFQPASFESFSFLFHGFR